MTIDINQLLEISKEAGEAILKIYESTIDVDYKEDKSPLTDADRASNQVIVDGLKKYYPEVPIISEEIKNDQYETRKDWDWCFIVDPLDGTKEFIKRNGEFTTNIALIHKGVPVAGVVHVPVTNEYYFNNIGEAAKYQKDGGETKTLSIQQPGETVVIMGSRSHMNDDTMAFVEEQKKNYKEVEFISAGSSLKLVKVASGEAHMYPRFAPTMEWDTAAGQAVVEAAGGKVYRHPEMTPLRYNKENLLNPHFLVTVL